MTSVTMKTELVINRRYGGYSLSEKAAQEVARRKGLVLERREGYLYIGSTWGMMNDFPRNDPDVLAVVREMGEEANGACAELEIVEVEIVIDVNSYDGKESVSVGGMIA